MSTYAIGDVQGCQRALHRLLDRMNFDARRDRLWFVGDLVNRGPDSAEVLRFVRGLGDAAVTVLGNHDLHLLVVAAGFARQHRGDTIDDVLSAPDRDDLLAWLRAQPLLHVEGQFAMVHAGLLPGWSIERASALSGEVRAALQANDHRALLEAMYGNRPDRWEESLRGHDRLRVVINAMTRLRLCTLEGVMEFSHKTGLDGAPAGFLPWFDVPSRASRSHALVCGHWAALGLVIRDDLLALDSGCVWGRALTGVCLDDRRLFQVSCEEMAGTSSGE